MSRHVNTESESIEKFKLVFLHPRYWLNWLGLILFYFFSMLPLRFIDWVAKRLGALMANKNKKRFNIARVNLLLCFPDKTEDEIDSLVRQHFYTYVRSLLHYGVLWWGSVSRLKKLVLFEGKEQIDRYREQGKNIIALTCHNGGLEFAAIALSMHYACSAPYKPMRNEFVNWLVARGRGRLGTRAYTRDEGFRPLIRDTREGRLMIYLADEDLGQTMSHFVPFFGVQKATLSVLGRLAKSCDAVVIPYVGCYDEQQQKYKVNIMPALDEFSGNDEIADTLKMSRAIEAMVRQCMVQYFWTLRLFQSRPEGEESVYD